MAKSKAINVHPNKKSILISLDDICELYFQVFPTIKTIITETNEESISEKLFSENFGNEILLVDPFAEEELVREEKVVLIKFLRLVLRFVCLENVEKERFLEIIEKVVPLFTYMQQLDTDIKSDLDRITNLISHNPRHKIDQLITKQEKMEEWKVLSYLLFVWILKVIVCKNYGAQKYFARGYFGEFSPTLVILVLKYLADRKKISNQKMEEWNTNKNEQSLIVTIIGFLTDYFTVFISYPPSRIEKEVRGDILPQLNLVFPKLLEFLYEISEPPFECIKLSNFFTTIVVITIEFLGKKALRQLRSLLKRDLSEVKDLDHSDVIPEGHHNSGTVSWIIKLKILNTLYALVQFTALERKQLLPLSEYLPMAVDILNVEMYQSGDIESMLQNFSLTTCFAIVAMGRSMHSEELPPDLVPHFHTIFSVFPKLLEFTINALPMGSSALQIVCYDTIKVITILKQSIAPVHFEKILSYYHHDMKNIVPFREMLSVAIMFSEDQSLCYEFFIRLFNQVREMAVTDEKFYRAILLTFSLLFDMYNSIIDKNNLNIELLEYVKEKINQLLDIGICTQTVLNLLNSFSRILIVQCNSLGKIDDMKNVLTRLIVSIMNANLGSLAPVIEQDTELDHITKNSAGNVMMLLGKLNIDGFLQECKRPEDENGQEFISKVVIPKIISLVMKPLENFSNSLEAEKTIWAFNTILIHDICTQHTLVEKLKDHIPVIVEYINKLDEEDSSLYYEGLMKTLLLLFNFYSDEIAPILVSHILKLFGCFNNSFDHVFTSLYVSLIFQVIDNLLDRNVVFDFAWIAITGNFYESFESVMNQYALSVARRVLCRLGAETGS